MKTISFLLLIFAALALAGCGSQTPQPTSQPVVSEPDAVAAEGRVEPARYQEQSFAAAGQVAEVLVQDGDSVTAGQALARLSDSQAYELALAGAQQEALAAQQAMDEMERGAETALARQRLAVQQAIVARVEAAKALDDERTDLNTAVFSAAEANLRLAEEVMERLSDNEGIDPDAYAAAQARLATANASIASAEAALAALELKASMDGTVIDLELQPGQRVTPGEPVITLADVSQWVVVTTNLTENGVVAVEVGQPVEVRLEAVPGLVLAGDVARIGARFEENQGDITYAVTVVLEESDPALRWGMTASVQFNP